MAKVCEGLHELGFIIFFVMAVWVAARYHYGVLGPQLEQGNCLIFHQYFHPLPIFSFSE